MTTYYPRSSDTQAAYDAFKRSNPPDVFSYTDEEVIRMFKHWVIIENRFPYDNMTRTNHLLVSKAPLASLAAAAADIKKELDEIIQALTDEGFYHARIENFSKVTSIKSQYHMHLVQWHNTSDQSGSE